MEPEMQSFVEVRLQEADVICPVCEGTGKDYFHDDCNLCDGIRKLLECGDEIQQCANEGDSLCHC